MCVKALFSDHNRLYGGRCRSYRRGSILEPPGDDAVHCTGMGSVKTDGKQRFVAVTYSGSHNVFVRRSYFSEI